jgi:hypothetical protein
MTATRIPQDIVYDVLSWLADEAQPRSSLRAATLVCKVWLMPARRILFRDVRLRIGRPMRNGGPMLPRLLRLMQASDAQGSIVSCIKCILWDLTNVNAPTFCFQTDFPPGSIEHLAHLTQEYGISHSFNLIDDSFMAIRPLFNESSGLVSHIHHLVWSFKHTNSETILGLLRQLKGLLSATLVEVDQMALLGYAYIAQGLSPSTLITYLNLKIALDQSAAFSICHFVAACSHLRDLSLEFQYLESVTMEGGESWIFADLKVPPLQCLKVIESYGPFGKGVFPLPLMGWIGGCYEPALALEELEIDSRIPPETSLHYHCNSLKRISLCGMF